MGYFDYLEDEKAVQMRNEHLLNANAKIGAWISIGGLGAFLVGTLLVLILGIDTFFWFGIINVIGIVVSVVGITYANKTLKVAKDGKIKTDVGNMAFALNLMSAVLNLIVVLFCIYALVV